MKKTRRRNKQTTEMMRRRPCRVIDFLFVSSQLAGRELKHAGADIKTIVKEFLLDHKCSCVPLMWLWRNTVRMVGGDGNCCNGGCDGGDDSGGGTGDEGR